MPNELTHLDLFSGIGGFALAAQWAGFRTVGFCEIDKFCQKVLAKRFLADAAEARCDEEAREHGSGQSLLSARFNERSGVPILPDIRNLDGRDFYGATLITGGFPCQPFSCAGKRRGKEDDRHLWPEMLRVISEARPAWVLGENVTGIIDMELDQVLSNLESVGYATRTFVIPACGVDAPHRRNRAWIVGYTAGTGLSDGSSLPMGKPRGIQPEFERSGCGFGGAWAVEPNVGRVAHGIRNRVDRLKALGNAIVPQVAYQILKVIAQIEEKACQLD